jgi:hypothetical protein
MARTQQINHERKVIFFMDFSNLKNFQEVKGLISESIGYIRKQPRGSVLTLTNIQGMHFNNETRDAFNDFIKGNKPYVKAGAVVGLSGLQQIIYNSLMKMSGRDIKSFAKSEDAKSLRCSAPTNIPQLCCYQYSGALHLGILYG